MLKKILAVAAAAALALTLSACGGGTTTKLPELKLEESSPVSSGEEAEIIRKAPDSSQYEDDLLSLMAYMEDGKAVVRSVETGTVEQAIAEGDPALVQMSYQEIGAVDGYRYRFTYNKSTVQVEFYEFDPANLNEKGAECVSMVKEKGFFEILGKEVQAVLHPGGRYLMIYTDANVEKDQKNADQKAWAEELFLGFPA